MIFIMSYYFPCLIDCSIILTTKNYLPNYLSEKYLAYGGKNYAYQICPLQSKSFVPAKTLHAIRYISTILPAGFFWNFLLSTLEKNVFIA